MLVESNERLFDAVTGGSVYRDEYRVGKGRYNDRDSHFRMGGRQKGKGKDGKGKGRGRGGRYGDRYNNNNRDYGPRRSEASMNPANNFNNRDNYRRRW